MPPKTQKRNFGICVPIMKFRYISFQTKRAWAEQWAKNSRASLAVQDENFAKAIMKALEKESGR